MNDWQPIETAPKDGSPLWLIEDGRPLGMLIPHQFVACWKADRRYEDGGFWQAIDSDCVGDPTHWMPLPDPPKAEAPQEQPRIMAQLRASLQLNDTGE